MKKLTKTFALLIMGIMCYAQTGIIENINVLQRDDGSGIVDVYFDLSHTGDAQYDIGLEASFDGGNNFEDISSEFLSGDVDEISAATGLHIVWDGLASHPNIQTEEAMLKITATLVDSNDMVSDVEGNQYPTVTIGEQKWMAKNLKTTKYNNGDDIITGLNDEDWDNTTSGAYVVFPHDGGSFEDDVVGIDSDQEMADTYGLLYNYYVVIDERGVCPEGWRIPTDDDWGELLDYIMSHGYENEWNSVGGVADALRSTRMEPDAHPRWEDCAWEDYEPLDEFGFNALPSGRRTNNGFFFAIGREVFWWSSTAYSDQYIWTRNLSHCDGNLGRNHQDYNAGVSIRCVKE